MVGSFSEDELSPNSKLKFLCSYGGRILPRPSDGQLKYVGGETRVVAVPRSITFSELMDKVKGIFQADVIMKYQLMSEDLDALVSVTSDEDLRHMLGEYDRFDPHSPSSSPRLRVFLFPVNPPTGHIPSCFPHEQRYIDAINGIPVPQPSVSSAGAGPSIFNQPSIGTSPTSTIDATTAASLKNQLFNGQKSGVSTGMTRVRSTPDISSLAEPPSDSRSGQATPRIHHQQHTPQSAQSVSHFPQIPRQHSVLHGTQQQPNIPGPYNVGFNGHNSFGGHYPPRYQHLQPYYYIPYQAGGGSRSGSGGSYGHYGHAEEGNRRSNMRGCFHYGTPRYKRAWE